MSADEQGPESSVAWARQVNARWIVHHGLKDAAQRYMDHLEGLDPARLRRCCERAHRLMTERAATEDPKPWFYAGLFSLATRDEAERFLSDHWFTASCIPSIADSLGAAITPAGVGPDARAKYARIQEAVRQLA